MTYDNCPVGEQVEHCIFAGMGHCGVGGSGASFDCPGYEASTALQWEHRRTYRAV